VKSGFPGGEKVKKSLGLLEVKGLAGAITVADVMAKVAVVELVDIEKAKGFGWMTVKVVGDVAAVQASIDAGAAKAKENGSFVAAKVIPRPDQMVIDTFLPTPKSGIVKKVEPEKEIEEKVELMETSVEPEKEEVIEEAQASKLEILEEKIEPVKVIPALGTDEKAVEEKKSPPPAAKASPARPSSAQ
jgi:microcompartment protein CcmL/EutN